MPSRSDASFVYQLRFIISIKICNFNDPETKLLQNLPHSPEDSVGRSMKLLIILTMHLDGYLLTRHTLAPGFEATLLA